MTTRLSSEISAILFNSKLALFFCLYNFFLMSCSCLLVDSLSFELTSFVRPKCVFKREDKSEDVMGRRREGGADSGGN